MGADTRDEGDDPGGGGRVVERARRRSAVVLALVVVLVGLTVLAGWVTLGGLAGAGPTVDDAGRLRMLTQRAALAAAVDDASTLAATLTEITETVERLSEAPGPGYDRLAPEGTVIALGAFVQEGGEVLAGTTDPEVLQRGAADLLPLLDEAVEAETAYTQARMSRARWLVTLPVLLLLGIVAAGHARVLVPALRALEESQRREVAARREAEAARRAMVERFDAVPHPSIVTDREGRVVACNRAAVEHYGWPRDEVVGVLPPWLTDRDAWIARCRHVGQEGFLAQVRRRTHGGAQRSALCTIQPLDDGTLLHLERDVTDELQRAARQRHRDRVEAISRLAGGVSHDFNNLLTAIGGHTELLRDETDPSLAPRFQVVLDAVQRARELVRRLLAVGSVHPGDLVHVDLGELVADLLPVLDSVAGPTVRVRETELHHAVVLADPVQLEQVLLDLVSNARRAMPEGGTVELGVGRRRDAGVDLAWLTVVDTGVGIPAADLQRVFDPFFTTFDESGDHGLGLSVVEGIVTRLGGRVEIDSVVGSGTTVRVLLPLAGEGAEGQAAVAPPPVADEVAEPDAPLPGAVLVVEDDEHVALLMERVLRDTASEITVVRHPAQALIHAESASVDLLVTDLELPGLDGGALAERVRALHPAVRVVLVTGHGRDEPRIAAVGADALLEKPFRSGDLRDLVTDLLRADVAGSPPA
ncbi:MAG: ATP-binding protein [Actinomycetes bacterium]